MSRFRIRALPAPHHLLQYLPFGMSLILLPSALLLSGCGKAADAKAATPIDSAIPVRVTALNASTSPANETIEVTGTLAGKEEVTLAFKLGGVISRILVDPGQSVRAGQLLAELRPTEIAAQVSTAQEGRRKAERDLARVTRLYTDSVATLEQLQDARTGLDVATNATRIAQFNADFAVIRATGDGLVLERTAEPGQVIEPGRSVLRVRRNSRGMVVRVGLRDRDAVRVKLGDSAIVTFDALPGETFHARVTQRAAISTAGSGDYAVEVTLFTASTLPSGLVARVALHPQRAPTTAVAGRVMVPLDALVDADADSAAVFVLHASGTSVSRRPLKLTDVFEALRTADVPIVSGLTGTETVVTAGMARLLDGTKVRVITTAAQRTASDAAPSRKVGQ